MPAATADELPPDMTIVDEVLSWKQNLKPDAAVTRHRCRRERRVSRPRRLVPHTAALYFGRQETAFAAERKVKTRSSSAWSQPGRW